MEAGENRGQQKCRYDWARREQGHVPEAGEERPRAPAPARAQPGAEVEEAEAGEAEGGPPRQAARPQKDGPQSAQLGEQAAEVEGARGTTPNQHATHAR